MSKRDDLVPFERRSAHRWTRISDYLRGADAQALLTLKADGPDEKKRISRRALWLPVYGLGFAAAALWMSGALDRTVAAPEPAAAAEAQQASAAPAATSSSEGLVFGLCDQGGGTNCVVDGDSFYMDGKSIQVAGIDAPETHSAGCDAESLLGWAATERLHAALNSGTVTTSAVTPGVDGNGRLLRTVKIDGRNVAATLTAAGLARPAEPDKHADWC